MTNVITATYASPLKGVSQQNPRDRVEGQCEEQVNLVADPVRSLTIRPPVKFSAALRAQEDSVLDLFTTYKNKEYILSVKTNYAELFCITDNEKYTRTGGVPEYITNNIRLSANADTILLLNTDKVVKLTDELSTAQNKNFVVNVRGGAPNTTYGIQIKIDGKTFTKTYKVSDPNLATADNVAQKLFDEFNKDSSFKTYFNIEIAYNCLWFDLKDKAQTYTVSATDGYNGQFMIVASEAIRNAEELPKYAPDGYVLRIAQLPESKVDDYYMKYVIKGENKAFGKIGNWVETTAVGIKNKFDLTTMPHEVVINDASKSFEIKEANWYPRRVGDEKTNPTPSFVGKTINDMDIVQGRVAMASQSFFMTRSKEPLDCYRNSATVLVDSDPIDIENTVEVGKKIDAIIQYGKSVSLYAEDVQFLTDTNQALNPVNTAMPVSSNFSYDGIKPVTTGVSVIHSYKKGDYTALLEIYPRTDERETPFSNITEQVEKYIKGNCKKMISNLPFSSVFVMTKEDKRGLYQYKYLFSENEKLLSAWCKLEFPFDIDNVFSHQDKLYLIYTFSGQTYLGSMPLDYPIEEGLTYTVFLDNKVYVDIVDGEGTLPYTPTVKDYSCVMVSLKGETGNVYSGLPYEIESIEGNKVILKDKEATGRAIIGIPISWSYIPNRPYVRDGNGDIDDRGKLNIISFVATLQNTASFRVGIVDLLNNEQSYEVSANRANFTLARLDKINLINDTIVLPFNRESARYKLRLYGKSYAPFTLVDLAYRFKFYRR